jgi:hypothetical protein
MALKKQEKMVVVNMCFLNKIAALWMYHSMAYSSNINHGNVPRTSPKYVPYLVE